VRRMVGIVLLAAAGLAPSACGVPVGDEPGAAVAITAAPDVAAGAPGTPGTQPGAGTAAASAGPTPTTDPAVIELIKNFELPGKGPDDALVTVYEFSDYLCPYCRQYATDTAGEVDRQYVDKGLIRFVYWDFPLASHGWPAVISAEATHCAGEQGQYWEMHDALFGDWRALADLEAEAKPEHEAPAREKVLEIAADVTGLDQDALKACVEAGKYRPVLGALLRQAMDEFKINATPSFLVMTKDHAELVAGFLPFEEFKKVLDREISRALGTPIPDPTATLPVSVTP